MADPCDSRIWSEPSGLEDTAQQLALSTLDGAACDLGVSREELTRALANDQTLEEFLAENNISREQFDEAMQLRARTGGRRRRERRRDRPPGRFRDQDRGPGSCRSPS